MAWHLSFVVQSMIQINGTKQALIPQVNYREVCVCVCVCLMAKLDWLSMYFDQ